MDRLDFIDEMSDFDEWLSPTLTTAHISICEILKLMYSTSQDPPILLQHEEPYRHDVRLSS